MTNLHKQSVLRIGLVPFMLYALVFGCFFQLGVSLADVILTLFGG